MPRIYGLIPTTDDLPFAVGWFHVGGPTVPNSGTAYCTVGTYTMPFDGELHANFTTVYYWTGHQYGACSLYGSTPTPAYSAFQALAITPGGLRGQMPAYGYWSGLLKGQVVTIVLGFTAGGGGSNISLEIVSGYVRAVRVGS